MVEKFECGGCAPPVYADAPAPIAAGGIPEKALRAAQAAWQEADDKILKTDAYVVIARALMDFAAPAPAPHSMGLIEFAKAVIQVAFEGGDLSGADIQDMAVERGLLTCEPFDPAKHKDPNGYAEEGDYWYVFDGPLAAQASKGGR